MVLDRKSKDQSDNNHPQELTGKTKDMIDGIVHSSEDEDHTPWQLRKKRKREKTKKTKYLSISMDAFYAWIITLPSHKPSQS